MSTPLKYLGDPHITIANHSPLSVTNCPLTMYQKHGTITLQGFRNTSKTSRLMVYNIYDDSDNLRGTFNSIYDLERYIDGIRNSMGDAYPNTPRSSTFDYIKHIKWYMEVVDNSQ